MKHIVKSYFCLAVLLSAATAQAVVPYIAFRSQSVSSDRDLVGETHLIKKYDKENIYGVFAITAEYQQSFRNGRLGRSYLGGTNNNASGSTGCNTDCNSNCDIYTISGSQVTGRSSCDWLADYFGLDPAFKSTISISPKVKTFTLDFNLFLGLDEWWQGLYFKIHAPFVHVKNKLEFCEQLGSFTGVGYPAGYFGPTAVTAANLNQSFAAFAQNEGVPNLGTTVTFAPLTNARFSNCESSKNGVAEVRAELGWNFLLDQDYHLGIGILGAAPTGKRPHGEFLFEPMIGNGKRWELGGAISGHYTFWRSEDEECNFGVYLDANITHIFKGRQRRTFDLIGKPLSRYMLAEQVTGTSAIFAGATQPATAVTSSVFSNAFTTVANLTTQDVKVSNGVQADLSLLFNYTHCNWSFDLGYNLWATSCEKIQSDCGECSSNLIPNDTWALKGDGSVYAFLNAVAATPFALSGTDSTATINAGSNYPVGATLPTNAGGYVNTADDNPLLAWSAAAGGPATELRATLVAGAAAGVQQFTSVPPVYINQDQVDFQSARTKGLSNKVFGHISYAWNNLDKDWDWVPFLGVGANVEFGSNFNDCNAVCSTTTTTTTTNNCESSCSGCERHALTQWGVWVKGGISFN